MPMNTYRFEVEVHAETREQAHQVMLERLARDEDYGFPYAIGRLLSESDEFMLSMRERAEAAEAEVERLRQQWADEAADACEARARAEAAESERDAARAELHAAQEGLRAVEARPCPTCVKEGGPYRCCKCCPDDPGAHEDGQHDHHDLPCSTCVSAALASPVESDAEAGDDCYCPDDHASWCPNLNKGSDAEAGAADTQGEGVQEARVTWHRLVEVMSTALGCDINASRDYTTGEWSAWCETCGGGADEDGCTLAQRLATAADQLIHATPEAVADREGGEGR